MKPTLNNVFLSRPRDTTRISAMIPPISAVTKKMPNHRSHPTSAPTAAISLTSPAPMARKATHHPVRNKNGHGPRHEDRDHDRLQDWSQRTRHTRLTNSPQDSRPHLTVKSIPTEENRDAASRVFQSGSRYFRIKFRIRISETFPPQHPL